MASSTTETGGEPRQTNARERKDSGSALRPHLRPSPLAALRASHLGNASDQDWGGNRDRAQSYRADLSDLAEVRQLSDEIIAGEKRLDVLVNNAGIGTTAPGGGERMQSADGYELRFAVNYLAGFLLTRTLLPDLIKAAPARIVNVSSAGQAPIDFDDVMLSRHYSGVQAYCQSKLAQIMFTFDLADELSDAGVTATALHPATYMPTKIVASPVSTLGEGVNATMRLIADPALDETTGRYYNRQTEAQAHPQAYDRHSRNQLRELSEQLTKQSPRSDA
ncbi:MAG: SDR family NAD(P)-dependent oxidoreductase [Solirubrobacteraceae bacterium]